MNKAGILCRMDRGMMRELSRRSLKCLAGDRKFRLISPLVAGLMYANTEKEVEKDALIIRRAVRGFESGIAVEKFDVEKLFRETAGIDEKFVAKFSKLPLRVKIDYDDIIDIREQRIRLMVSAVYGILSSWTGPVSFKEAVRRVYAPREFEAMLEKFLWLYSLETRAVGDSFRLPLVKKFFVETVFSAMKKVSGGIAGEIAGKVFAGGEVVCPSRS